MDIDAVPIARLERETVRSLSRRSDARGALQLGADVRGRQAGRRDQHRQQRGGFRIVQQQARGLRVHLRIARGGQVHGISGSGLRGNESPQRGLRGGTERRQLQAAADHVIGGQHARPSGIGQDAHAPSRGRGRAERVST